MFDRKQFLGPPGSVLAPSSDANSPCRMHLGSLGRFWSISRGRAVGIRPSRLGFAVHDMSRTLALLVVAAALCIATKVAGGTSSSRLSRPHVFATHRDTWL